MRRKQIPALLLSLVMVVSLLPMAALANGTGGSQPGTYVLMNIPYAQFYAAEVGENDSVDAVTSATTKFRNQTVAGGSYHESADDLAAAGVVYPVLVSDLSLLDAEKQVTDTDSITVTYAARGGAQQEATYTGKDVLIEKPDYSWYQLTEAPACYKTLTVKDGAFSFSAVNGDVTPLTDVTGDVSYFTHHGNYVEISLNNLSFGDAEAVSGVIVTFSDGTSEALNHIEGIWRKTQIGWAEDSVAGKTIRRVKFITPDHVYTAEVNIPVTQAGYVLMNIPYPEFYAAETGETGTVDAVSGATLKYANSGIAGGSYHDVDAVDAASPVKALGVTYPVLVTDLRSLDPALEVKADGKKTVGLVTGREKTITPTEVTGADQLFRAPSYSWMTLDEAPARYKTMTEDGSGALSFGAVSGRAATVEGVTGSASYYTHHGNFIEVRLNGVTIEEAVSGVLVTFDDGSVTALPHVQGFWQKPQIGWASPGSVAGKTITKVRFLTRNSVYDCPVTVPVKLDSGPITAAFSDTTTLTVTGLPADIETPVATVRSQVGRGETPVVIAENVPVTDGQITTTGAAVDGTVYAVTVTSDNYGDLSATAKLPDLSQVTGTYQPLFEGATFNSAYDHYWHDYTAAVVGGSAANDTVAYMKASVGAKGYGDNNEAPSFFCGFTNDVAVITFGGEDGRTVTFTKTDGTSVTHTYAYWKEAAATGKYGDVDMAMNGHLYRSQEGPADEFRYLLMFPDTPDTTYHLEFRYAGTEEEVLSLLDGPYAYWVGSAIRTSALTEENEDTLQKVISLFVVENLAEMQSEETSAQRAGLVGTWDFLDSAVLNAYGFDSMYIVLSADGTGRTFAAPAGGEPTQISAYTFFAYDPVQADGRDSGAYLAMNPAEETVTPGEYEITTKNGRKALVFTSNEGEITYYLRKEPTPSHGGGGGGTVTPATNAITLSNGENGTVSADVTRAKAGENVTVTVKPDQGYRVDAVKVTDKDGKEIPVTDNGNGTYSFTMPASQASVTPVFVKADTPAPTPADNGRFADVPKDAYYSDAVDWAVAKGITAGVDDTRFAPDASCTRAQMVTFLWRAAGSPAPAGSENPFTDVRSDAYYAKAVLWAVEKGITQGTDASHFSPNATVNRAQSVTFLYRFCGEKTDGSNPFTDVAEGAYYYDAVLWAVARGVTNGTSPTAFSPRADCTRAQIVTFLYRATEQA